MAGSESDKCQDMRLSAFRNRFNMQSQPLPNICGRFNIVFSGAGKFISRLNCHLTNQMSAGSACWCERLII